MQLPQNPNGQAPELKRTLRWLAFLIGLGAIAALVAWQGVGDVAEGLAAAGPGILLVFLIYVPHMVLAAWSWGMMFAPARAGGAAPPGLFSLTRAIWLGGAVNALIPSGTIGGEFVKARMLTLEGFATNAVTASVVGDKTVQTFSSALWALCGVGMLIWLSAAPGLVLYAALGVGLLFLGGIGFMMVQRAGKAEATVRRITRRMATETSEKYAGAAAQFDIAIADVYSRPGRFWLSVVVRTLSRAIFGFEVWLAAWLVGHPITLVEAMMLRAIAATVRDAAFLVPNGLGVQEGAWVLLAGLIGLDPATLLAISLISRIRELISAGAGMAVWQVFEGRALLRKEADLKKNAAKPASPGAAG